MNGDGVPAEQSEINTRLADLREYARKAAARDDLVCRARRAGASYADLITASGLSRGTVTSILTQAGLTGPHPTETETTVAPTQQLMFPHHPHFISARKNSPGRGTTYEFRPFTGAEPEPVDPVAGPIRDDLTAAQREERWERSREIEAARDLWMAARYRLLATPLVKKAVAARPKVDEALAAMGKAWEALDTATVWPVAVKRLLAAHEIALAAMYTWVDNFAEPLAEFEGKQENYVQEQVSDWRGIARSLGYEPNWDIGNYYAGDRRVGPHYSNDPVRDLKEVIATQRATLDEVARFSPQPK